MMISHHLGGTIGHDTDGMKARNHEYLVGGIIDLGGVAAAALPHDRQLGQRRAC